MKIEKRKNEFNITQNDLKEANEKQEKINAEMEGLKNVKLELELEKSNKMLVSNDLNRLQKESINLKSTISEHEKIIELFKTCEANLKEVKEENERYKNSFATTKSELEFLEVF